MSIIINQNPRAFGIQDVSQAEDVNDVLTQLNVGTFSKVPTQDMPTKFHVIKDDNGNPLSIVRNTYDLLQPIEAFAFLDSLQNELGFTYENAGFTHEGNRLFIQGSLGEFEAPSNGSKNVGDVLDKRIVATTSFDGSRATEIAVQILRVWCANGCASWTNDNAIANVKHTRNQRTRLNLAVQQATGIRNIIQNLEDDVSTLSARAFTPKMVEDVSRIVFPNETKQAESYRETILSEFDNSDRGTFGETAWDCFNAFTAWNTHERTLRETKGTSLEESAFRNVGNSRSFAVNVRSAIDKVYALAS